MVHLYRVCRPSISAKHWIILGNCLHTVTLEMIAPSPKQAGGTVKDQSFTHHQSFTRSNVKSRRSHPLAKFFLHIYLQCIDSFFCEFLCTLVCCACHNTENIPKILNHWNFLRFGNMLKASRRVSDKNGKHCIINHYVFVALSKQPIEPFLCYVLTGGLGTDIVRL